jgi:hypothetical protein
VRCPSDIVTVLSRARERGQLVIADRIRIRDDRELPNARGANNTALGVNIPQGSAFGDLLGFGFRRTQTRNEWLRAMRGVAADQDLACVKNFHAVSPRFGLDLKPSASPVLAVPFCSTLEQMHDQCRPSPND